MVRAIPGLVRLLAVAPVYSPKLPVATDGTNPDSKLCEAADQEGVNGTEPSWLVLVMIICDVAELPRKNHANNVRTTGNLYLSIYHLSFQFLRCRLLLI